MTTEATDQATNLVQLVKEILASARKNRQTLEEDWLLAYDAFKGEYSNTSMKRWKALEGSAWRSKVFVKVTRMKVVSAVAEANDVLFQGGQIPFSFLPTPYPEGAGGVLPIDVAHERARNMEVRVRDDLVQCKYDRVQQMANLENAMYGMNCLKSPVTRNQSGVRYRYEVPLLGRVGSLMLSEATIRRFGRHVGEVVNSLIPKVENPSIWNVYWDFESVDPEDGFNIHTSQISPAMLYQMAKGKKLWKADAVNRALMEPADEGERTDTLRPGLRELVDRKRKIRMIEYWGPIANKYLRGTPAEAGDGRDYRETEVFLVIAGDELVVPPIVNPHLGFMKPFHFGFWDRIPHEPKGVGIPHNMMDAQMVINSTIRCFIDNKAISGNVLGAVNKRMLDPHEDLSVWPGKMFELADSASRAQDAITWYSVPDVGRGLLDMYRVFDQIADEESGRPKISQGIGSKHDPKTAYGLSRLLENSTRQMGNIIRNIDEGNIEPTVESLYHYHMATSDDESIKGDYQVQAKGFATFEDRVAKGQSMIDLLNIGLSNPILARILKPGEWFKEMVRMRNLDPEILLKSDDQVKRELELMARMAALTAAGENPEVAREGP